MADSREIDWGKLDVGSAPQPPARETVVVHCANGHRLVVPAALAGKWGKCSKCQAAFQIPTAADAKSVAPAAAPPPHADGPPPPATVDPADQPAAKPPAAEVERSTEGAAAPAAGDTTVFHDAAPTLPPYDAGPPRSPSIVDQRSPALSIADLVARLWEQVADGAVVELHLSGGSVVLPKWFERRLSGGTHGLFASQAVDGSITLTAVAWDAIQKVVVRNVNDLPEGMFEETAG